MRNQRTVPNRPNVSRRDMVVQSRSFLDYNQLALTNVEGDFSFGITSFNTTPRNNTYIGQVLEKYGQLYEQYKITNVRIKAQCGKGFTNDRRIKTILVSRVDVDNQDTAQTFTSFRALANASNSKTRTLTEKGNVVLCEYKPIMFDNYYTSNQTIPVLPNQLQWNRIDAVDKHQWRGAVLSVAIPETNLQPDELKITLTMEYQIQFRGRINNAAGISASPEIGTLNPSPVTYDLTTSEDALKNNLLTGTWFPININHSIGNIGAAVTGDMLLNESFRVQATGDVYVIVATDSPDLFCNLVE